MQNATNFLNQIKRIFKKQTQDLLLIEIAFIVLAVTVALNYVFDYVNTVSSENSVISSWEYVYTDGSSNQYEGEWNIASGLQPLSTEKTGDYLHLRRSFEPAEEDRALVIFTDYSPIKIAFNGETVYNNHYNDSAFAGNCYNSVTLPASNRETDVEISIALPFSAQIRTELSAGRSSQPVRYGFWLVSSAIIFALSVLMLPLSVVLSFKKAGTRYHYYIVSAAVIAYGAFSFVFALSNYSYLLNFPRLHNLSVVLVNLFVLISLIAVSCLFHIRNKGFSAISCGYFVTTLLILLPQSPVLLKVLSASAGAAGMAAAIALAGACEKLLAKRIQFAKTAFMLLCYMAMLIGVCGLLLLSRSLNIWVSCVRLGGLVLLSFIIIVTIAATNVFSLRKKEAEDLEIKNHTECVAHLADLFKNLLSAKSETELCRIAAGDICNLTECFCRICPNPPKASDFAYGVAVKSAGGYRLIDSKGLDDTVRFDRMESHYQHNKSPYNFAETYFNFVFLKNNEPHIIFYFQNIKNGLSLFFIQVMEAVFNCMEIGFGQLSEHEDSEQKKENGFLNLAKNAEFNDGGKADHLQCVADYTGIIMKAMDYPEHVCKVVSGAAMLHDIGKIAIPQGITNKRGLLSEAQRSIMKKHTEFGYIILSAFEGEFMQAAAVIARDHHEQFDGSGYGGLKGEEIHEYARVATAADVFDALTTQRSYKEAWSVEAAMDYINANSGKIFDPRVVSAMNGCLDEIMERYREKNA